MNVRGTPIHPHCPSSSSLLSPCDVRRPQPAQVGEKAERADSEVNRLRLECRRQLSEISKLIKEKTEQVTV